MSKFIKSSFTGIIELDEVGVSFENDPINIDAVQTISKDEASDYGSIWHLIRFYGIIDTTWYYKNEEDRNADYESILTNSDILTP